MEHEAGINAFAAGFTPNDAVIGVTRGTVDHLSRDELQGVIAHEFSHILNGDMRLNLRLMGFSFGILVLSLVGRWLLRASARGVRVSRRGGGNPALLIGLGLTVIGFIGVLLSRLIKAAVSRQREVLADASAVQFTREPLALAGALKKIGGFTPFIERAETEEVSHMLFGQAGRSFVGLFATHPPLTDRIRALDPGFTPGDYISPASPAPAMPGADGQAAAAAVSRASAATIGIEAAGSFQPATGSALRQAIPAAVIDAAHSSQSSWLLVLALGLERGGGTAEERRLIENQLGAQRSARCLALRRELDALDPGLLLPLIELTIPALNPRPAAQLDYRFELLTRLAQADVTVTLFEFLLQRKLRAHYGADPSRRAPAAARSRAAIDLLAALATRVPQTESARAAAFAAGLAALGSEPGELTSARLERARTTADFADLDAALSALEPASMPEKQRVLSALAATMRHDGRTELAEAELFRAIAAVLGCPVPPLQVIG
jgi:hypothetical protein